MPDEIIDITVFIVTNTSSNAAIVTLEEHVVSVERQADLVAQVVQTHNVTVEA